jgi:hypothetical protein
MSAPDSPEVWVMRATGVRFVVVHHCDSHGLPGWTKLRSLTTGHLYLSPYRFLGTVFDLELPAPPAVGGVDELMALADAVGVVTEEIRPRGQQPASEFEAGPTSHGPLWTDDHLADVFNLRDQGGAR